MNGLELLQRIRRQPDYAGTQVLMVTTETGMGQMADALAAGANEYIMKPFTPDVVSGQVATVRAYEQCCSAKHAC